MSKYILKSSVSLICIIVALYLLDLKKLYDILNQMAMHDFLLIVLVSSSQFLVMGIRWYILIKKHNLLPFSNHLSFYFYGTFLNSFTPANLGGDIYRFIKIKQFSVSKNAIITALFRERMIGLTGSLLFFLISFFVWFITNPKIQDDSYYYGIALIVAMTLLGLFILPVLLSISNKLLNRIFNKKIMLILIGINNGLKYQSVSEFISLISLSLLAFFTWLMVVVLVCRSLGVDVSIYQLGMIIILVELGRLLPISIQGLGVRESMYSALFVLTGFSSELGFVTGLISYFALSCSMLIIGIIGFSLSVFNNIDL